MAFYVDENDAAKKPLWQFISDRNRARQYDFLEMSFVVSNNAAGLDIDHEFISTLNAYATRYISMQPGRYRQHYDVKVGDHTPSEWCDVPAEMEAFLAQLHANWAKWQPTETAAYALWGLNHVHPFCDGNGRSARALCYFVLCKKLRLCLPGRKTVLEQIRTSHRAHHVTILQRMHDGRSRPAMMTDLTEMAALLDDLVVEQINSHHAEQAAVAAGTNVT